MKPSLHTRLPPKQRRDTAQLPLGVWRLRPTTRPSWRIVPAAALLPACRLLYRAQDQQYTSVNTRARRMRTGGASVHHPLLCSAPAPCAACCPCLCLCRAHAHNNEAEKKIERAKMISSVQRKSTREDYVPGATQPASPQLQLQLLPPIQIHQVHPYGDHRHTQTRVPCVLTSACVLLQLQLLHELPQVHPHGAHHLAQQDGPDADV